MPKHVKNDAIVAELAAERDAMWRSLIEKSSLFQFIAEKDFDRRLYGIFLIETYHYVHHNPKHQALVAAHATDIPTGYAQFCYEHAQEETGHEFMAYHDLLKLGLTQEQVQIPDPLPETETFIAYLYYVSMHGNPLRRLGYSFWAEDSYQYIGEFMTRVRELLSLDDNQMTFLVSHATIDEKHADDVNRVVSTFCQSDADVSAVGDVMRQSLVLNTAMLDAVLAEYIKLAKGESNRYAFLNSLI